MTLLINRKSIPPHVVAHLQKLDDARAMLLVNGTITKAESEKIRRKIMAKARHGQEAHPQTTSH